MYGGRLFQRLVRHEALPAVAAANIQNHTSQHKFDILCQTICLTITTLLIAVRVYTKGRVLKSLGWEDCESLD